MGDCAKYLEGFKFALAPRLAQAAAAEAARQAPVDDNKRHYTLKPFAPVGVNWD